MVHKHSAPYLGKETQEFINKAEILIEALPYIQSLSGKTVVIKYGGNAMINEELKSSVMDDITLLKFVGINPVIVHGGGPDVSEMLEKMDIPSKFQDGLRVTDARTMNIAQMVLVGKTNKEIAVALHLSDKTVRNYLSTAFEKLHVARRSEAAALYAQQNSGRSDEKPPAKAPLPRR